MSTSDVVQVKLVGNIHGDEVVGRELLLGLADGLCTGWKERREEVVRLLESTEVHLLPSLNPDGFVLKTRNNANDRDLNRGFPDWADLGPTKFGPVEEEKVRQPEVEALMIFV